jgi:hypothetical protein
MTLKLTTQKVAGELKRGGFEQIRREDHYGVGFQVMQGCTSYTVEVQWNSRRHTTDYRLKLADMAEYMAQHGYGVVLRMPKDTSFGLTTLRILANGDCMSEYDHEQHSTPEQVRQAVADEKFHTERVRLEEKLEAVRKQMATLAEQEQAILAEMAAHIGG